MLLLKGGIAGVPPFITKKILHPDGDVNSRTVLSLQIKSDFSNKPEMLKMAKKFRKIDVNDSPRDSSALKFAPLKTETAE